MQPQTDPDRLIESIAFSPIAMVVSNPRRSDNPIEVANSAFCELTGYREADIVGHNCRFLAGPKPDPIPTRDFREALAHRRSALIEVINFRRDGRAFRNGVIIAPLFDAEGDLQWFLGSQVDLGDASTALEGRRASAAATVSALPPRQRQVLTGMAKGLLNKQIAWSLKISEKTVKMHRALLLERLGVRTSAEAIRIAVEAGL